MADIKKFKLVRRVEECKERQRAQRMKRNPMCKYQSANTKVLTTAQRMQRKPMGLIRQKKPKLQIANIHNICSVQREIWKLFSKLKKIDKLKLQKEFNDSNLFCDGSPFPIFCRRSYNRRRPHHRVTNQYP
ncbi:hypothetical protein AAZV13_01G052300 [Glycine max]